MVRKRGMTRVAVAVIAAAILAACGGSASGGSDSTTPGGANGDPNNPAGPTYPLLGVPVTDTAAAARVAIACKIDNHPNARPQSGLNKADIVFEENVEGLTRFAAVFHSQGSDPVGPLRSGRTQDIDILGSYNKPLFCWSGGNSRVTRAVNSSSLVNVGYSASRGKGGYYRAKDKKIPHNLYAKTANLWTLAPEGSGPPAPQFTYRGTSDAKPATSTPIDGAKVSMYNVKVYWKWDAASGSFMRFNENLKREMEPHMADDGQVNSKNVLVLYVTYIRSKADRKSPHAVTTGTGTGYVLTDGGLIEVKWERKDANQPFTLTDSAGAVVRMTPGRTWVELAWKKSLAPVGPGVDPSAVKWPAV